MNKAAKKQQANFFISTTLLVALRKTVGKRNQSELVETAIEKELRRRLFFKALKESAGTWKASDHPYKTDTFIRSLRTSKR